MVRASVASLHIWPNRAERAHRILARPDAIGHFAFPAAGQLYAHVSGRSDKTYKVTLNRAPWDDAQVDQLAQLFKAHHHPVTPAWAAIFLAEITDAPRAIAPWATCTCPDAEGAPYAGCKHVAAVAERFTRLATADPQILFSWLGATPGRLHGCPSETHHATPRNPEPASASRDELRAALEQARAQAAAMEAALAELEAAAEAERAALLATLDEFLGAAAAPLPELPELERMRKPRFLPSRELRSLGTDFIDEFYSVLDEAAELLPSAS
jgi:uncharacterized Zn finger protein